MKLSEMDLHKLREADDVEQVFQDFLDDGGDADYIDSLADLCRLGGYPDEDQDPEYSVTSASISGSQLVVKCNVFFDEKYFGGGCPDMPSREPRSGEATYFVDLNTGEMHARTSR